MYGVEASAASFEAEERSVLEDVEYPLAGGFIYTSVDRKRSNKVGSGG